MTRNRILSTVFCVLTLFCAAVWPQDIAKRPLIVPLAEGGFVAFKSETSWADTKKASELQRLPAVLGSQTLADDDHIIHRVLEDKAGRFIFGYDLWVTPHLISKQFQIAVRPLDPRFERKLRAGNPNELRPFQPEKVATFPTSTEPQTLDDGDAFSLDLLVNQNTGVKIVDVVRVTFDVSNLRDLTPGALPRDFTLDAVELTVKDYRLLVNGSVASVGKSTSGCAGALLWFFVQDRGRFIFSLVPRQGYEFQKVGIIEDNRIEFTVDGNHYEWLSSAPILSAGGTWNLWVLHDPKYTPLFGVAAEVEKKKGVWEKLDDAVNVSPNTGVRIGSQKQNALRNAVPAQTGQSTPRPRVMIGGADRIENLWPRNP